MTKTGSNAGPGPSGPPGDETAPGAGPWQGGPWAHAYGRPEQAGAAEPGPGAGPRQGYGYGPAGHGPGPAGGHAPYHGYYAAQVPPWAAYGPPPGPPPGFGPGPFAGPGAAAPGAGLGAALGDMAEQNGMGMLRNFFSFGDDEFWKGAVVGAALVMLVTNDKLRESIFESAANAAEAMRSGMADLDAAGAADAETEANE